MEEKLTDHKETLTDHVEWHTNQKTKAKLRLEARRRAKSERLETYRKNNEGKPVAEISHGQFRTLTALVPATTIRELSSSYLNVIEKKGNQMTHYGYHEWKISRSYLDDAVVVDEDLRPSFEPLIAAAQEQVEHLLKCRVVCDSACGHVYNADEPNIETGSSWGEHRDYASDGNLAFASVVVQGFTPESFEGGGLTMRVKDERTFVQLEPGDALLLRKTWHLPHSIQAGRRLVFVLFFRTLT